MDGLEFATTQELLQELIGRETFAGIILYSEEEQKTEDQEHGSFNLLTRAEPEDAIIILEKAAQAMKQGMH